MQRLYHHAIGLFLACTLLTACTGSAPLALSIEETEKQCYTPGRQAIPVRLKFQNLTRAPLLLFIEFRISPTPGTDWDLYLDTNILPDLETDMGDRVSFGLMFVDFLALSPQPKDFVEIPPGASFETEVDINIQSRALGPYGEVPLPSGQYLLRIGYRNSVKGPLSNASPPDTFRQKGKAAWQG